MRKEQLAVRGPRVRLRRNVRVSQSVLYDSFPPVGKHARFSHVSRYARVDRDIRRVDHVGAAIIQVPVRKGCHQTRNRSGEDELADGRRALDDIAPGLADTLDGEDFVRRID